MFTSTISLVRSPRKFGLLRADGMYTWNYPGVVEATEGRTEPGWGPLANRTYDLRRTLRFADVGTVQAAYEEALAAAARFNWVPTYAEWHLVKHRGKTGVILKITPRPESTTLHIEISCE